MLTANGASIAGSVQLDILDQNRLRSEQDAPGIFKDSVSKTHSGWTVGGGLEYAFAPNWSAKAEYLYVNLNREPYLDIAIPGAAPLTVNARHDFHLLRLGVNYRFGGAPIVASYSSSKPQS